MATAGIYIRDGLAGNHKPWLFWGHHVLGVLVLCLALGTGHQAHYVAWVRPDN